MAKTPAPSQAPKASASNADPLEETSGELPMPEGLVPGEINPALVTGFQVFVWPAGKLARVQAQQPFNFGGKTIMAEVRTGKVDKELLRPGITELLTAHPEMVAGAVTSGNARGRRGAYTIKTYGVYDRNVAGDGTSSNSDPLG